MIDAPLDATTRVFAGNPAIHVLLDDDWLRLHAMDESGAVTHRYAGGLAWERLGDDGTTTGSASRSATGSAS